MKGRHPANERDDSTDAVGSPQIFAGACVVLCARFAGAAECQDAVPPPKNQDSQN